MKTNISEKHVFAVKYFDPSFVRVQVIREQWPFRLVFGGEVRNKDASGW